MKKFLFIVLSTFTAFAGPNPGQDYTSQRLSFDDIRLACQNPAKFHNQVAPANIQISCQDVQYKWVADKDGALSMPTQRLMTSSVTSDKYTVDTSTSPLQSAQQVASCPRFKQITETVETVRAASCDELIAFTGNIADFCASSVNSLKAANPKSVTVADTGKYIDFCGGKDISPIQDPGLTPDQGQDQDQDQAVDQRRDRDRGGIFHWGKR